MLPTYVLRLLENRAIAANRTGGVWPRKSWVFAAHVSLGLARWNIRQSYFQVFTISKGIRNNISLSSISLPALITKNSGSEFRNKNRTIKNLSLSRDRSSKRQSAGTGTILKNPPRRVNEKTRRCAGSIGFARSPQEEESVRKMSARIPESE